MNDTGDKLDSTPTSGRVTDGGTDLEVMAGFVGRRWRLGLAVTLVTLVAVGVATQAMPPIYRASCLVLVEGASPTLTSRAANIGASLLGIRGTQSLSTEVALIRSPVVASVVWERLDPQQQEGVQEDFRVRALPDTQLIEITVWGTDPQTAADYSNTLAEQYLTYRRAQERENINAVLAFLSDKLDSVRDELNEAQLAKREFQERTLSFDLTTQASALVSQLSAIQSEQRAAQIQLAARQAELAAARDRRVTVDDQQFTPTDLTGNPVVNSLRQQLLSLKQEQIGVLQVYTPNSPEAQRIEARIERVTAQLQEAAKTAVAQELAPLQSSVWTLQAQVSALASAAAQAREMLTELPEQQYQLAGIELRVQTLVRTYELVLEQYEQTRLAEEQELAGARVASPAETPDEPERPVVLVNLALGLALGLILALAAGLLAEHLDDRIHDLRQLGMIVAAPVMAALPAVSERSGLLLEPGGDDVELARGFRRLRTALNVAQDRQGFRSVTIASPMSGDGRTFVAANLALDAARSGRNVLLVDADALHPQLATHFGVPEETGLSAVLAGSVHVKAAIQTLPGSQLKLLPWGAAEGIGGEALTVNRLQDLLDGLEQSFDLILIDSPAAALAADVQALAHQAQATLLVVSLGRTRAERLRQLAQQLELAGARVIGVVVNRG